MSGMLLRFARVSASPSASLVDWTRLIGKWSLLSLATEGDAGGVFSLSH
jgi:hypothetical protein